MNVNLIRGAMLASAVFAAPFGAYAGTGFAGAYGPGSVTITVADTGSIDATAAPDSITLVGGSSENVLGSDQLYKFTVSANGTLSFDWSYSTQDCCGAAYDPFGYQLNDSGFIPIVDVTGPNFSLGDAVQQGSFSLAVNVGDNFALDQNSVDNIGGRGTTVVSNFDGPVAGVGGVPEPATWALMLSGFGGLGVILRRRRSQAACATV
jgi:hypothetical protein